MTASTPKKTTSAAPPAPARMVIEDRIAWIHLDDPDKSVKRRQPTAEACTRGPFTPVLEALSG